MLRKGEIVLGNTDLTQYSYGWEAGFKGCLTQVRIGGVLLPFFSDDTFANNSRIEDKFLAERVESVVHHCQGKDVCSTSQCVNGGQCQDLWNQYECRCPAGLSGLLCEENADNCAPDRCSNGGQCVDGLAGYTCDCPKGFTGTRCENDIDLCNASGPGGGGSLCENNSSCQDRGYDFVCDCGGAAFTGVFCNVSLEQSCSGPSYPCANGGSCADTTTSIGGLNNVSSFTCTCPVGFEPPLCERQIDYCSIYGVVCSSNGSCTSHTDATNYTCDCSDTGYMGVNCTDVVDPCVGVDCGSGTCVSSDTGSMCHCPDTLTGPRCESRVDNCANSSFCQHGKCLNNHCDCTGSGYVGDHCEIEENECNRTVPVCLHDGVCTDREGTFDCNCTLGYEGLTCATPNCTADICLAGDCRTNATDWYCVCPKYYEGSRCETKGPCADEPCDANHTDVCIQSIPDNSYNCSCIQGWEGKNCSEDIDECSIVGAVDCGNGTCRNLPGTFRCECFPGFTGAQCEQNIDECLLEERCFNGGQCRDGINSFTCDCTGTGYQGDNCSADVDECLQDPPICHQGNCVNGPGNFTCICDMELYLGDFCQLDNPCLNVTCMNGGSCQYSLVDQQQTSFICECADGYDGPSCEKSPVKSDDDTDLILILVPILGGLLFIALIVGAIWLLKSWREKRASHGVYSPSQQESSGSRVELGNVLKKPPEERLI
ncbi:fibropellin-1 [Aplysia californica]|uniref:Fibropellin-1 n=1 Tax=Aplysia californica TaxID=6500 RepID=A0ABM0JD04_APLCA|nr:fibropellin-1 [Aplysia californica]